MSIFDRYPCGYDVDIGSSEAQKVRAELVQKLRSVLAVQGMRKPVVNDIFHRVGYISPDSVRVVNYLRRKPVAIFNPGAVIRGSKLWVFPRIVFDYYWYVSSIGFFEVDVGSIIDGRLESSIDVELVLTPSESWEIYKGCEDPRIFIHNDVLYILYTAVGTSQGNPIIIRQAMALLNSSLSVTRKLCFAICTRNGVRYRTFWKDSAILDLEPPGVNMLTRPSIPTNESYIDVNWFGVADMEIGCFDLETMEPVMGFEKEFEYKVGWSTNTLKVSSNEYLVGWHAVGVDNVYRNGLAVISREGELLGVSDYLLAPRREHTEFYGDRPGVVFGNGLVEHGEYIIWVGGVSDYCIGIFKTEKNRVFERIRWLRG
ncbi:MAG: hypothetical protein RMI45_00730 [Ignisphaera sp.]|nr:hypothetical protein [Ignisphaera sp.]MDW8084750.1 hypothetical protein [Ignisphaera sp.]